MTENTSTLKWLTPAQMAERTGVSMDTLRYYEREGLLQTVRRTESGHRRYSADDVLWVGVLRCLRTTGMNIEQLRGYCELGEQGDHTQPERLALLLAHKSKVEQQITELQESLQLIDYKINVYQDALKGDHS